MVVRAWRSHLSQKYAFVTSFPEVSGSRTPHAKQLKQAVWIVCGKPIGRMVFSDGSITCPQTKHFKSCPQRAQASQ
jgi:hypothetical protein